MVRCWKPESFLAVYREARELLPRCTNGFVPVVVRVERLSEPRGYNLVFAQPEDWRREREDGEYRFVPVCVVQASGATPELETLSLLCAAHRPAVERLTNTLFGASALMRLTEAGTVEEAIELQTKRLAIADYLR